MSSRDARAADAEARGYPEHAKLQRISHLSQAIGEFLDWAESQGWHLCTVREGRDFDRYEKLHTSKQDLLARHFQIDQNRLDDEKRAMLDALRSSAEERTS